MTATNLDLIDAYLSDSRDLAVDELRRIVPRVPGPAAPLYDLVLDYPLREAKALRPALCIATCRALGGPLEGVLPSAAILELYHNAFLIHDDVEDDSDHRRGREALHREYGSPIAINVGDAMLALALEPLLDNMRVIGLGKALRILKVVARMARESTEGQALELGWIRNRRWDLRPSDYVRMVYKKTSWYTFIAPTIMGGIVAGASSSDVVALRKFAALLGIAFQIQDDVLNLTAEGGRYGKEPAGDLWEGKRTLILLHAVRSAGGADADRAQAILAKSRPRHAGSGSSASSASPFRSRLARMEADGALSPKAREEIDGWLGRREGEEKSEADIAWLRRLIERYGSIDYARGMAADFARRASRLLHAVDGLHPSSHRDFLHGLVDFVISRDH